MNAGKPIRELEEVASVAAGSSYIVESGDGAGTKRITHENLVKAVGDDLPLGIMEDLQTDNKDTLVGAINETLEKTDIPAFEGVEGAQAGKAGLVPAPQVGDEGKVLGSNGQWVTGGGGGAGGATIHVTTEDESLYGKQVTVTDGHDQLTGTMSFLGVCDISGVMLTGNLTVSATNDQEQTAEAVVNVTYYGTYNVVLDTRETVSYINVTTTETSLYGRTVTAKGADLEQQAEAVIGNDGKARIKVEFTGEISVTASDGVNTASATLNISEPDEQSVTLQLYHMTVTTEDESLNGHFATLQKGGQVRTGTFVGKAAAITFDEQFVGACKVSATDGQRSAEKTVTIVKGSYSYSTEVTLSVTYTAILDFGKSDPMGMITYEDDAAGMEKDFTAWRKRDIFKNLRNCVLKNGQVEYYLDPDDLTKQAGGEAADITTPGNDVMLEIPERLGYMIEWQNTGKTILKVSVTNRPNADGYEYDAFSLDSYNDCDKIYIGVFKGYRDGTGLYSSSGRAVTVSQTIDVFRASARQRGDGYQQRTNGSMKLMQCLFIISHGTLNSQAAVGWGYVASGHTAGVKTGGTNAYGFDSEVIRATNPAYMTDQQHQVKCLGLEDFWGNYWEFIDGLCSDASRNILTCRCAKDFDTDGTGYENNGNGGVTADLGNYMNLPQGGSKAGFTARAVSGSQSTYFCDYAYLKPSCLAIFGGYWNSAACAGAFRLNVNDAFSLSNANVGARLMYMHKDPAAAA